MVAPLSRLQKTRTEAPSAAARTVQRGLTSITGLGGNDASRGTTTTGAAPPPAPLASASHALMLCPSASTRTLPPTTTSLASASSALLKPRNRFTTVPSASFHSTSDDSPWVPTPAENIRDMSAEYRMDVT